MQMSEIVSPQRKQHVGKPNIGDAEAFLASARDILESQWLTNNGAYVQNLEKEIQNYLGVKHVVAVCNGTLGLRILLSASLDRVGEVIVPDFTFIATAQAVTAAGHRVVIADVDERSHCLSPAAVEKLIGPDTVGILGVHLWGNQCFVEEFREIADRHGVKLFFDAAHAFGCRFNGHAIGGFGDAEVFSFHATKVFNTFEGGAIVTNNDELAAICRKMRNFGFIGTDMVECLGINAKMTEISAAMGLVNLKQVDHFIAANHRNYVLFKKFEDRFPGLEVLEPGSGMESNYHYVVARIDESAFGASRDRIVDALWSHGVRARRYFYPGVSKAPPYQWTQNAPVPVSQRLCQTLIIFPTGPSVTEEDVELIASVLLGLVGANRS
jgi:dTDP-4-amino-4,6-dideoxygalactose transaminase